MRHFHAEHIVEWAPTLCAGDEILLSGSVFVARDAVHKRLVPLLGTAQMPFDIRAAIIYYAGPTPPKHGMPAGSFGPTTSSRMDRFVPDMMRAGLCGMIGKAARSEEVREAIRTYRGIYLCAVGGAGALAAMCSKSLSVIAFEELGCESLKVAEFEKFPLFVGIDSLGNSIFDAAGSLPD